MYNMKNITEFLTTFNTGLKRASRLADVLISFADGYANALDAGAEVIDLREKPNAQPSYTLTEEAAQRLRDAGERLPRRVSPKSFDPADLRMSKVPGVPTTLTGDDLRAALGSILALKAQVRVVDYMARKRDDRALATAETVLATLDARVAAMEALDPSLTEFALRDFDKAHLSDFDEASDLDVTGGHWTDSDLGDATTIRYNGERAIKSNNKGDLVHAGYVHRLSEDALAEALAA